MTIRFYNVKDDNRKINKTLGSELTTVDAKIYGQCSMHEPSLLLRYSESLVGANYFKIDEWNRYYFIEEITCQSGKRAIVSGSEDVLMSNADEILNLVANVEASQIYSHTNKLLVDSNMPMQVDTVVTTKKFNKQPFEPNNGYNFVLTVMGG